MFAGFCQRVLLRSGARFGRCRYAYDAGKPDPAMVRSKAKECLGHTVSLAGGIREAGQVR